MLQTAPSDQGTESDGASATYQTLCMFLSRKTDAKEPRVTRSGGQIIQGQQENSSTVLPMHLGTNPMKCEQWGDSHSFTWPPLGPEGVPVSQKVTTQRKQGFVASTLNKRHVTVEFIVMVKRKGMIKENTEMSKCEYCFPGEGGLLKFQNYRMDSVFSLALS